MREILRTASISLAESLRLALDAQDIPAVVRNENLGGLPPASISVVIADDADYERSLQVLEDVEQTTPRRARKEAVGCCGLYSSFFSVPSLRSVPTCRGLDGLARVNALPNKRLKLTAPVVCGRLSFVIIPTGRRSLGAYR